MERMRTPLLTSLILLASSTTVLAQANQQPAAPSPAGAESAPAAAPSPEKPVVVPFPVAPNSTLPIAGPPPADTGVPATVPQLSESTVKVGLQRLPSVAYPDFPLRGIKFGSLWLTFHGLQWPYMPYIADGEKFVIGISGWAWVDNSYQKFGPSSTDPSFNADNFKLWKAQSRMLLRVTPTYAIDREHFIQGQVELVGTGDQTIARNVAGGADTDDLWVRVGKWNRWDLQVGRFEGWEVFHLGMGLDFNTFERTGAVANSNPGIAFYGLTDNQFRPGGAVGNAAWHYYPLPFLRFELLGMAGSFSGPVYATRPVAILDFGWVKLKVGTEYQKMVANNTATDNTELTSKGVGGALQFVLAPHIEFGVNAAQGTVLNVGRTGVLDGEGSYTRTSLGAFANVSNGDPRHPLIFGVGSLMTWTDDQNGIEPNPVDHYWLYQGFVAAQYVLYDAFFIKLVGGYSKGHWSTAGNDPRIEFDNEVYSARLRFSFYF
jgi:hypothetical protein